MAQNQRRRPTTLSLFAAEQNMDVERHAYCLCLHVRPATIFIALFNLGSSMTCGFYLMFMAINGNAAYIQRAAARPDEPVILSGVSILMCFFMSLVSAMMLYGVIKAKPSYVLPFFCIQFIEYLHTILQFIGRIYAHPMASFYGNRSRHYNLDTQTTANGENVFEISHNTIMPPNTDEQYVKDYTSSLLVLTTLLIFRTYFLSVVWKCYRYLHLREYILPITLAEARGNIPYEESMIQSVMIGGQAPPPKYEEAIKYPAIHPPAYEVALEHDDRQQQQSTMAGDGFTAVNMENNVANGTGNMAGDVVNSSIQATSIGSTGTGGNDGSDRDANSNVVTHDINNNPVSVGAPDTAQIEPTSQVGVFPKSVQP